MVFQTAVFHLLVRQVPCHPVGDIARQSPRIRVRRNHKFSACCTRKRNTANNAWVRVPGLGGQRHEQSFSHSCWTVVHHDRRAPHGRHGGCCWNSEIRHGEYQLPVMALGEKRRAGAGFGGGGQNSSHPSGGGFLQRHHDSPEETMCKLSALIHSWGGGAQDIQKLDTCVLVCS